MSEAQDLVKIAERLDESPAEMLNGAAQEGLQTMKRTAERGQEVARSFGLDANLVHELWDRAAQRLRRPEPSEDLYAAAADAAVLLYTAGWLLGTDSATTEDIRAVLT